MEMRFARLIGVAHCIVPQQIVDPSLHMQPPLTLQKMMKPQPIGVSPILQPMEPPPSIVQIIVPAALVQETVINTTEENLKHEKIEENVESNDTNLTPALAETHLTKTEPEEIHEEQIKKEENDTTHSHEMEPVPEPDASKSSIQDVSPEKSVDDSEIEEAPETDPIQEFNKIRSAPEAYPPLSLSEILHEVLPQPQRTHASLESEQETDLENETPPQKDDNVHEEHHHQQPQQPEEDDDDLLQETLADIVDDMSS